MLAMCYYMFVVRVEALPQILTTGDIHMKKIKGSFLLRAKKYRHTYTISDGVGCRLASVTLYNMARSTAADEARKMAESLSPDSWSISYEEEKTSAARFIADHVEVRS